MLGSDGSARPELKSRQQGEGRGRSLPVKLKLKDESHLTTSTGSCGRIEWNMLLKQ